LEQDPFSPRVVLAPKRKSPRSRFLSGCQLTLYVGFDSRVTAYCSSVEFSMTIGFIGCLSPSGCTWKGAAASLGCITGSDGDRGFDLFSLAQSVSCWVASQPGTLLVSSEIRHTCPSTFQRTFAWGKGNPRAIM